MMPRRAWTLVELLVAVAAVALLIGLLLPALSGVRAAARGAACLSNQRQLIAAWTMYAGDFDDRAMPLAYWSVEDIGAGEQVFWFGSHGTASTPPDPARGFMGPYLGSTLREGSVLECASQPWGTYRPQGPARAPTSTYGYNGYYLSPAKTPGWAAAIGHRPWRRLSTVERPAEVLVFADTLLPSLGPGLPGNTALLDPPRLYSGGVAGTWSVNASPTTAFRHAGRSANAALADGHARAFGARAGWIRHAGQAVGSVGGEGGLGPWYVPDWAGW